MKEPSSFSPAAAQTVMETRSASCRYDSNSGGEREIQRTMLELLNQLDGFDSRGDVKVIMATNRIETLDPALIRPGQWLSDQRRSCRIRLRSPPHACSAVNQRKRLLSHGRRWKLKSLPLEESIYDIYVALTFTH